MKTVDKIQDIITKLDELENDLDIVLDPSYLIDVKLKIYNIDQKISLGISNDIDSLSSLHAEKYMLNEKLELIKDYSLLHSNLLKRLDDFILNQHKFSPHFERTSNKSVLSRIHPFYKDMGVSGSHRKLVKFFETLSVVDKVDLINTIMEYKGRSKIQEKDGELYSSSCSVFNTIMKVVIHPKGFYLVKLALNNNENLKMTTPAALLRIILKHYNRRTTSLSVINHDYE